MQDLANRTAVVTGAASGIGKAVAQRLAAAGMNLVLADVEEPVLLATAKALEESGAEVLAVVTDVSDAAAMDALGKAAYGRFGSVQVLCNNAGVASGGLVQDMTQNDWEWVLGVNLWGVIHGHRVFLGGMVDQNEGHIVNTASICGHLSFANMAAYNVSKHAVVTLSETLFAEMVQQESKVGVTVLCPGLVNTNILDSDRNRPEPLMNPDEAERTEEEEALFAMAQDIFKTGKSPDEVAELVYQAIVSQQLYLFTDGEYADQLRERHSHIENSTNPTATEGLLE